MLTGCIKPCRLFRDEGSRDGCQNSCHPRGHDTTSSPSGGHHSASLSQSSRGAVGAASLATVRLDDGESVQSETMYLQGADVLIFLSWSLVAGAGRINIQTPS